MSLHLLLNSLSHAKSINLEIFLQIIMDDLHFFRSAEKLAIIYYISFMRCFIRSKWIYPAKFGTKDIAELEIDCITE